MVIKDDFSQGIDPYWTQVCIGGGSIDVRGSKLRMGFETAKDDYYTDAQVDDYTMLPRSKYLWEPPLKMTVRAKFSLGGIADDGEMLKGTAGFGFWNNPFSLNGDIRALPEAIWFFYSSPPSDMKLVPAVPGWGWKAQSIHMVRPGFFMHVIPTLASIAAGKVTGKTGLAERSVQRLAAAYESPIKNDMRQWHTYVLEWRKDGAYFSVDGKQILATKIVPRQPLGFVAWLDNQYAVATPQGVFKFGKLTTGAQWLDIDSITIESFE